MILAELAEHDGRDGRRAHIAVNGTVYDVTDSPHWKNGLHPPDHQAGQDLTEELSKAPHVRAVIERFPVVGTLEEAAAPATKGNGKDTGGNSKGAWGNSKIITGVIVAAIILALVMFLAL